jgi:hypothetical protein
MTQITSKTLGRRIVCAILLGAAAFAVNHSSTLNWGGAGAPDGTRYKVSPVGILHVLQPRQTVSPFVWARWSPEMGAPALRAVAPGGEGAYVLLKLIYPALRVAFWLALIGAALALLPLRCRRRKALLALFPAGAALTTLAAVVMFINIPPRALAVLAPLEFGFGGTLGGILVGIAPLLNVGVIGLLLRRSIWFMTLGLIVFNLVVWYPSLLFLIPIAAILLYMASRPASAH